MNVVIVNYSSNIRKWKPIMIYLICDEYRNYKYFDLFVKPL